MVNLEALYPRDPLVKFEYGEDPPGVSVTRTIELRPTDPGYDAYYERCVRMAMRGMKMPYVRST